MKYAIILPDGAADEPLEKLGGRTVLEAANTPNMDYIARIGQVGRVLTTPMGFDPGSDICTLSLLGYAPERYHTGRAPLEAAARDITIGPEDLVFRCNLVTITDGQMRDFTAGHIDQADAEAIMADLNQDFAGDPVRFHAGVQYRHLLVAKDAANWHCICMPPHDIPGQPVDSHLPIGDDASLVRDIMDRAAELLATHAVNRRRRQAGVAPATGIWLWGQGRATTLPRFAVNRQLRCASIAAVDLIRGITKLAGFDTIDVPGATGFLDTDYDAKGQAAIAALDHYDLLCVHIEAPDEAGHLGDTDAKVTAIERIDKAIVGPILAYLQRHRQWRILVAPDHPTPVGTRVHSSAPPPFCMAGTHLPTDETTRFAESVAARQPLIDPGDQLMRHWLDPRRP